MIIIKIESEWNNSHCSLNDVDYILPGWTEINDEFIETWNEYGPFVAIAVDDNNDIIEMIEAEEIIPEEPVVEDSSSDMGVWDELATAITEGVNEV